MNSKTKTLILLVIFSLFFSIADASLIYTENIQKAHSKILEFEYSQAQIFLSQEKKANPKNRYIEYLENYHLFLNSYFEPTSSSYEEFENYSENCIDLLRKEKNREEANLLLSMIYIQKAYCDFLWDNQLSYANALIKGQNHLNKVSSKTTNLEYLKLKGIYEVINGSVPSSYKWYAKWLGVKGSPKGGLEYIEKYLENPTISSARKTEGQIIDLYLRSFLDYNIPEIKAIQQPLLAYVYLQTSQIKNSEKIALINQTQKNFKRSPTYLYFLLGKYLLQLQNSEGMLFMSYFEKNHKGIAFEHTAQMYKAWYSLANNDSNKYNEAIQKINSLDEATFPADKKAVSNLRTKEYLPFLLKARMLFDAGNYHQALSVLKKNKIKLKKHSTEHKIEYLYRLARIHEKTNQTEKAIKLYQEVIKTQETQLYFIAYSAYRMGKVYAKEEKKEIAKEYFLKALELNEGEYKISIEKKSQFALKMLE